MKRVLFISLIFLINFLGSRIYSAGYNPLPDTGQTKCYNNSSEIPCSLPGEDFYGQDANYQGLEQKFTVQEISGDKVVIDENTGLMWMQGTADTNNDGKIDDNDKLDWQSAVNYCENLNYAGYDDWRLPTLFELSTIVNYGTYKPAIDKTVLNISPTPIGLLLPMRTIQTVCGLSILTMAIITGPISLITVMLGA